MCWCPLLLQPHGEALFGPIVNEYQSNVFIPPLEKENTQKLSKAWNQTIKSSILFLQLLWHGKFSSKVEPLPPFCWTPPRVSMAPSRSSRKKCQRQVQCLRMASEKSSPTALSVLLECQDVNVPPLFARNWMGLGQICKATFVVPYSLCFAVCTLWNATRAQSKCICGAFYRRVPSPWLINAIRFNPNRFQSIRSHPGWKGMEVSCVFCRCQVLKILSSIVALIQVLVVDMNATSCLR